MVIGIIWLLAALLFPVFSSSRKRAGESVCTSHLRPIGMALRMYLLDCDDQYPPRLLSLMPAYVSSRGILLCFGDPYEGNASPPWFWVSPGTSYF